MNDLEKRKYMVESQLKARGISNKYILKAFEEVPRHRFVPDKEFTLAYADVAVPIGHGQTISQPYIIAKMLELLDIQPGDKVLEVGSGSGYAAALISRIAGRVIAVERVDELVKKSKDLIAELKYKNVKIVKADGSIGNIHYQPYDKILVSAAMPEIPEDMVEQLNPGGVIVAPTGERMHQKLTKLKKGKEIKVEEHDGCMFVPVRGKKGFIVD